MKSIIKGMTLLLAGASFVACSKDVAFDENAQKEAKAQAELQQKFSAYDSEFVKAFGSIAPDHKWGFDKTRATETRGAVTNVPNDAWEIPEDLTSEKNGNFGNAIRARFEAGEGTTVCPIDLKNYWMQHIERPKMTQGQKINKVQAYDSSANNGQGGWVTVTNFVDGQNNGFFTVTQPNRSVKGTTLMENMGGGSKNGKFFRWGDEGNYEDDYKFITTDDGVFLGLKHTYTTGSKKDPTYHTSYWVILLAPAEKANVEEIVEEGTVFCEDMGSIGDFDFNDVVFNAVIYSTGRIEIEIVAAGGTLPIKVADELVALGKMKNTGEGNKVNSQKISIQPVNGKPKYNTIKDIPVEVIPGGDAASYLLGAGENGAPQKICIYRFTPWPDEYINIKDAYPSFETYVNSATPDKWIDNAVGRFIDHDLSNNAADWTDPNIIPEDE